MAAEQKINGRGDFILKTAFWMAAFTLISKLLGFAREMVIALYYGTSYITDAYVMSTTIPNILFGGIFSAIATAYMPIFSSIREKKGEAEGERFTSQIINLLLLLSIVAGGIGIVFSDQIVSIFASGFQGETAELTSFFVKISFWYVIFNSTAGILEAYLQYKGVFIPQIVAGFGQNIGIILVVIISGYTSHHYLAFGMILGTGLRFLLIYMAARKKSYAHRRGLALNDVTKKIMTLALPVFFGVYIFQINTFVDKTLASGLQEGSIAALNYAMILMSLFGSMTANILVTIIYPKITKANSLEDKALFSEMIRKGFSLILIIITPCSLGAIAFSKEIVQIVYERGAFDVAATTLTATAFLYYSIGMLFMALNDLLVKIYYSLHDMRTPILWSGICVGVNICLNLILVRSMGHNGLALSTAVATCINTALLYVGLKRKYTYICFLESKAKAFKIAFSSATCVAIAVGVYRWMNATIWMPKMVSLGLVVLLAAGLYFILLRLFQIEEFKNITAL